VGALFRDLFRSYFHLPVHYMYEPGSTTGAAEAAVGSTVSSREAWDMGRYEKMKTNRHKKDSTAFDYLYVYMGALCLSVSIPPPPP